MAYALYPEIMEKHFKLQGDAALLNNKAAANIQIQLPNPKAKQNIALKSHRDVWSSIYCFLFKCSPSITADTKTNPTVTNMPNPPIIVICFSS